ncbi:MAG TPA: hypothetical protein VMT78_02295 [Terriglobia bacterium]|nr:hypothetical protein [Terriglobia bacterium]
MKRLSAIAVLLALASLPINGQSQAPARSAALSKTTKPYTAPRTVDGQPDLQGFWTNVTLTPLQRPANLANKEFFTPAEAEAYEKQVVSQNNADRRDGNAAQDVSRAYNDFWWDRGTKVVKTLRTSLIIDPPDGRIPAMVPGANQRLAAQRQSRAGRATDGPEFRPLAERCLLWATAGPPMMPSFYNNNYQIVQNAGFVVILVEMIHDARIIPIDNRPHLPGSVRQWLGNAVGHWEGDTLVVETTNFTDKTSFQNSGPEMKLIERFTRTDNDTLMYEYTVNDPSTFVRPWTAQIPMSKTEGPIWEYACHEGNYAMTNVLSGARAEEKAAAGAAAKGGR